MYQTLIQRYENGTAMVMDQKEGHFHFLGTAFIVHGNGYMLTAAHILRDAENPILVTSAQPGKFSPLTLETANAIPVSIAQRDDARDMALLKMEMDAEIDCPDDILGNAEDILEGTTVLTFGVSFGHLRIHNVMVMNGMLSAKLISLNETRLLLFDQSIHPGAKGGPLVNAEDGRIVGMLQGIFNPLEITHQEIPEDYHLPSHLSYAVSIEYAKPMLEAEGLSLVNYYSGSET